MKKVLVMIGTRPECIKLAPLAMALAARPAQFEVRVCLTSQHKEMLQQALDWFPVKIDYDLELMTQGQHLVQLQARILDHLHSIIIEFAPDIIVVQGDTTTAMASATAGCFNNVTVAHVEAGLRTFNRYAPWPEEINRLLISNLAEIHLAPTEKNAAQLLSEKVAGQVAVVGNTVIDALLQVREKVNNDKTIEEKIRQHLKQFGLHLAPKNGDTSDTVTATSNNNKAIRPFVLITGHRRESFGDGMVSICDALSTLSDKHPDTDFVYAVHLNPQVQNVVHEKLSNHHNIILLPPLEYGYFVYLMDRCHLILSDSGGIQEEAPSLNKPVLVMRDTTEREEAVEAGAVKLVGTDRSTIIKETSRLLTDKAAHKAMADAVNPFGNGDSSEKIADILFSTRKQ